MRFGALGARAHFRVVGFQIAMSPGSTLMWGPVIYPALLNEISALPVQMICRPMSSSGPCGIGVRRSVLGSTMYPCSLIGAGWLHAPHQIWPGASRILLPVKIGPSTVCACGQDPVTFAQLPDGPRRSTSTY